MSGVDIKFFYFSITCNGVILSSALRLVGYNGSIMRTYALCNKIKGSCNIAEV